MRLSVSLALWLLGISAIVLGVHGWSQLVNEEDDLYAAAGRELTLVVTAVRSSIENAVRDGQETDIHALLAQLELKDPSFDVFVFRGAPDLLDSSWGSAANLERARAMLREHRGDTLQIQRLPEGHLVATAPVRARGRVVGHVVILRPTHALAADLREERNAVLVSIGLLAVVLSFVIWTVVRLRLQRPISQMIAVVRRVAAGDLTARIRRSGSDELAEFSREFDATMDALEAARLKLSREAETREKLENDMLRTNRLVIVGELAATLAHEVGSPLQVLGGRARDIVRRNDICEEVLRSARIIADQSDRLHGIVERFLDVARRKAPVVEVVVLEIAVGEVAELLASQARRAGVHLEVDVPAGLTIRVDPSQLQQVLLNLLQNALHASQPGSTVQILAEQSWVASHAGESVKPAVALSIEDEGPGIPEEDRGRVFQPFFSGWGGNPMPKAGTGLGLSVVKSIVTDHGGVVEVHPARAGKGTCFIVRLPTRTGANEEQP